MVYKNNTPNYNTKSKVVSNFTDFNDHINDEKEELKDIKRGINDNHDDTQKNYKNSKYKFNRVTRKMDDLTRGEIEDKLKNLKESKMSNTISALSRFIEDYGKKHNNFEKRGLDEGIKLLRNSKNREEAIKKIDDKIIEWGDYRGTMSQDKVNDIIKGLEDLSTQLEMGAVMESNNIDYESLVKSGEYDKLVAGFEEVIQKFKGEISYNENDIEDNVTFNNLTQEALLDALKNV